MCDRTAQNAAGYTAAIIFYNYTANRREMQDEKRAAVR
jgi:hypothetical protein